MINKLLKPENYPGIKTEFEISIMVTFDQIESQDDEKDAQEQLLITIYSFNTRIPVYFYQAQTLQLEIEIENAIQAYIRYHLNEMKKLQLYFQ